MVTIHVLRDFNPPCVREHFKAMVPGSLPHQHTVWLLPLRREERPGYPTLRLRTACRQNAAQCGMPENRTRLSNGTGFTGQRASQRSYPMFIYIYNYGYRLTPKVFVWLFLRRGEPCKEDYTFSLLPNNRLLYRPTYLA